MKVNGQSQGEGEAASDVQSPSESANQEQEAQYLELVRESAQANYVFKIALHILPTILFIVYFWSSFVSIQEYIQAKNISSASSVSTTLCLVSLGLSIYVLHLKEPSRFFMRAFLFVSILPLLLMGPSTFDGIIIWGMPVIVHLIQSLALKLIRDDMRKVELQGAKLKRN
ncbi:hypothetical protein K493DRAFT_81024 [Basidiobolus meristosporus CBS 931.73]|uniref:Uncharacterized protein n=1 Tax=Basidiobolus meristosporus CBS 931.73 TaxID=1314790 RepID=A0A1Y1XQD1_9FUNG|nr:hypothetical protein K493DRAFT_81024 [Basidiobolus meristosporus CBS 931.73]|eukprot:ORX87534.1 hypothetical protein K493DRAFT_81024 [Basidiobolus meristosporus CBS 931.73]